MLGQTIGHFKILEKIGEGGMGIVYKAKDTKLDREIALKFLPAATLSSKAEKDRFIREARAAAALNHPNIAHIYAIEEVDNQMFIAMEYIDGDNLHDMIASTGGSPLSLTKAIDYTIQIAQGLKAAHDKNIVHRDVKSANMMLTQKGSVKIMDFGLAKLSNKSLLTQQGTTLGTISYMSPEQASGKSVDHRSDIWSLGVILYEMLSGKLPFSGDYEQAVIYNILNTEPEPLTAIRSGLPLAIDGIIAKCLAKDPQMRYQHVDEIPADLKSLQENNSGVSRVVVPAATPSSQPSVKRSFKFGWPWQLAAALFLITLSTLFTYALIAEPADQSHPSYRFEIALNGWLEASPAAISPDGKSCAYAAIDDEGVRHLFISRFDMFQITSVTSGENVISPFFSPDGKWIGYFNGRSLKKIPVSGGSPIILCEARGFGTAHWADRGSIVFSTGRGIISVNSEGGSTDTLVSMDENSMEVEFRNPYVLPGRNVILYTARVEQGWRTMAIDLETGIKKDLIEKGLAARYVPTGHLVYQDWNEESLLAVPFDIDRLEILGPPKRVIDQVRYIRAGTCDYHFSDNGSLIYTTLGARLNGGEVCWVDKEGIIYTIPDLQGQYVQPRFSPDGKKLVLRKIGTHCQLWLYDIERGTLSLLTMEGDNHDPLWTADGRYIAFHRAEYGTTSLFWQRADGSQNAQLLAKSNGFNPQLSSFGNKSLLVFNEDTPNTGTDVMLLSMDGKKTITPLLQEKYNESRACVSPNGRWLAYTSDESGDDEVYLRPFQGSGPKILVSKGGGTDALWAPDGKSLYYRVKNKMMRVPVTYQPEFSIDVPEELFEDNFYSGQSHNFDISPDGKRFVMIYNKLNTANVQNYRLVLNWFDELQRLAEN